MFSNGANPIDSGNNGGLLNSSSDSDSSDSGSENNEIVEPITPTKNDYRHPPLVANGNISVVSAAYDDDAADAQSSSSSSCSSSGGEEEYDEVVVTKRPPPPSKSNRLEAQLGLTFPVARTKQHLREITGRPRISVVSGIGMAAAMESLTEYILEQAENALPIGPITGKRKRSKMLPKDLQMSCQNNETMTDVIRGTVIAYGGVLPNMPISLLGPRRKRSSRKKKVKVK